MAFKEEPGLENAFCLFRQHQWSVTLQAVSTDIREKGDYALKCPWVLVVLAGLGSPWMLCLSTGVSF